MTNAKYERIWKLLNEYQFKFNAQLNNDYMCTICQGILRNPYQSPCGCRYCMGCITDYLGDGEKYCPGGMEECGEQRIQFERDLQIDYVINKKISRISVNCPMELCGFSDELSNIEEHISTHNSKCPYQSIGCSKQLGDGKGLNDHLTQAVHDHATLLMDTVGSLTRQVASLKRSLERKKKDSLEKDALLEEMEKRLDEMRDRQSNEINDLKQRLRKYEAESANERNRFGMTTQSNNDAPLSATEQGSLGTGTRSSSDAPIGAGMKRLPIHSVAPRYAPFTWTITDFKKLHKNARDSSSMYVTSDAFYSNPRGYKLCLTVHPDGTGIGRWNYLSVFVHIMSGEFDEELQWPMKREARLCLVDRDNDTFAVDKTRSFSTESYNLFRFDKPSRDKSIGFGDSTFISLADLYTNDRLCQDDSIMLKCFISDSPPPRTGWR